MGDERFERYLQAFEEDAPVSIRLNPMKIKKGEWEVVGGEQVAWCQDGYYLPKRPNFTMDPLLHAGCYYVQEAASMFLDEVMRQLLMLNVESSMFNVQCSMLNALDLCAAPGGKSTLLRSALPENWVLYSNEPIRNRANILKENVTKWGYPNHEVTNLYPRDYRKQKRHFDLILCDVPCSGEGMFRKDEATIKEWSPQNVEKCWQLQREIVSDAWKCLNDGGVLIYSTCTFNTKENEENIRWMMEELGAQVVPIETKPEWNITGSLLEGFNEPVYRFIPGITRGEGLFMAVMRKKGEVWSEECGVRNDIREVWSEECGVRKAQAEKATRINKSHSSLLTPPSTTEHSSLLTPHSTLLPPHSTMLSYKDAIAYLRGEALVLPEDTPRGIVEVNFMGYRLGEMKNIGTRANNLYPKEWRIKTTHIPNDYEAILRHT